MLLDRPATLHGALRLAMYCDGEDSWWPGCGSCGACGGKIPRAAKPQQQARWFCRRECQRWWRANHQWGVARAACLKRDRRCTRCHRSPTKRDRSGVTPVRLEVNHIRPRNGEGYQTGCHNHQDNLEALCSGCHAGVTAEQGRERRERAERAERAEQAGRGRQEVRT